MSEITDEMLMAFADGELNPAERSRVEAYLQTSADGVRRLEVFATTGRGLADIFDQPMREPVPQFLLDAVAAHHSVVDFHQARSVLSQRSARWTQRSSYVALAASVAVLAIGASGFWLRKGSSSADPNFGVVISQTGDRWAADGLSSALEMVASGIQVTRSIADRTATIKPDFTFATSDNRYCRQYVISPTENIAYSGVACRMTGGEWRVVAHEPFRPKAAQGQKIVTAGKSSVASIDAIVDQMISGDVLSLEDEGAVMAGGWVSSAH